MGKFNTIYIKLLECLGCLIWLTCLDRLIYIFRRPKLTILMYHGIISEKEKLNEVTVKNVHVEQFKKQLNYIKKRFSLITLESAIKKLKDDTLPRMSAVLTFDDGYENNYSLLFPLLKKNNITATIFLTGATNSQTLNWNDKLEAQILKTEKEEISVNCKKYSLTTEQEKISSITCLKTIGNQLRNQDLIKLSKEITEQLGEIKPFGNYKILNWKQVNDMKNYGIEFGAHSISHPGLPMQDENVLNYEIGEIKNIIEKRIAAKVKSFSYPTGLYNDNCIRVVKEQDYECAVTTRYGFNNYFNNSNSFNLYELERIAVGKNMSFPLFVLNLIIPLYKIDKLVFSTYHKIFKPHNSSVN